MLADALSRSYSSKLAHDKAKGLCHSLALERITLSLDLSVINFDL